MEDTKKIIAEIGDKTPPQFASALLDAYRLSKAPVSLVPNHIKRVVVPIVDDLLKLPPTADAVATYLAGQIDASPDYRELTIWLAGPDRFDWSVQVVQELHRLTGGKASAKSAPKGI